MTVSLLSKTWKILEAVSAALSPNVFLEENDLDIIFDKSRFLAIIPILPKIVGFVNI